ncbi:MULTISPECIES: purple acid phosphatase family protein [Staphylococcus]|uniref:purple acid phosphatase family protein n=1 Tax=Staphylococcus TaxID=1279 RepID=UPI0008A4B1D9|nr:MULTISPECIES: metallophosphoesterase family protein [Staphylococcus]ARB78323.1 serine/threonine protein phosphatase [Staphylococcus lugdunensis]MCH8641373.1 metallophosphoesterase family protein [Staphylococcus lugdunensis]MCH8644887.1 metallophosphoesterase family protein [Staphylococcus lugdunensis]MCH8670742.1 metallophosphoesterase family protein [Staphylococcus lugdunensis]MDK7859802.1 metallophosphoesterase family protein [Staphylococcus lugdunensis]
MYLQTKKSKWISGMASMVMVLSMTMYCPGNAEASGAGQGPDQATNQNEIKVTQTKPHVAPIPTKNSPNRIMTNFNGNTQKEMGFSWYTTDRFKDAKVWVSESGRFDDAQIFNAKPKKVNSKYLERDDSGHFIFKDVQKDDEGNVIKDKNGKEKVNGYYTDANAHGPEWTSGNEHGEATLTSQTEYTYKAKATGLKPNTKYYYKVGSLQGGQSTVGQFQTSGNKGDAFKFVQYTDTQNAFWNEHVRNEAQFGADTLNQAIQTAGNPNFALHTGDFVETSEIEDEWADLYNQSRPSFMSLPVAATAGNHDEHAFNEDDPKLLGQFNQHVNVPKANNAVNGGSYYSFDYNGAHMVVANTNDNKKSKDNPDEKAIGKQQMAWIKNDIKQARKKGANWIILNLHKPMYSKSYHALSDEDIQKVRNELTKEIDDLDVDLVLQGHDHVLARTHSLRHTSTKNSFVNARKEDAKQILGDDHVEYYDNPKGSVYVLPNTGGTKAYDDIYDRSLKHIKKVRPELKGLTQRQLDHYNSLFAVGKQPQKTSAFKNKHANNRDSSAQNFSVYEVSGNKLKVKIYQLYGDISKGEPRDIKLIDEFGIKKDKNKR